MELSIVIQKCLENDKLAQSQLWKLYAARMFTVCRRYLKTDQDAEDVMINGFRDVLMNINTFKYINDQSVYAWIKKIMIHQSLKQMKQRVTFLEISRDFTGPALIETDPFSEMESRDILRMVIRLPLGYRTIFNLHEVEGYTHREIAEELGITENASKLQLYRARVLLQQFIDSKENESTDLKENNYGTGKL